MKIINPDTIICNGKSPIEKQLKETICLHWAEEANSNIDCPYDGAYCRQKHLVFLNYRGMIEYNAANHVNKTFLTNANMFHKCPLAPNYDCIRRLRYENIVKQLKQNAKQ